MRRRSTSCNSASVQYIWIGFKLNVITLIKVYIHSNLLGLELKLECKGLGIRSGLGLGWLLTMRTTTAY